MERGEIRQGLTIGISLFEVFQKQSQFLRIELDGRLCTALDAVVPEIVLKYFS